MNIIPVAAFCALMFSFMASSTAECAPGSKAWRDVASGSQSNIEEATRQVIQDQEQWRKWWQRHNTVEERIGGKTRPKPAPKVDFEEETVLAVTMGRRSTGGYAIRFIEVRRKEDVVTAVLQIKSPGPEEMVTMALTSPFAIIAIPKHEGCVEFIEKAEG